MQATTGCPTVAEQAAQTCAAATCAPRRVLYVQHWRTHTGRCIDIVIQGNTAVEVDGPMHFVHRVGQPGIFPNGTTILGAGGAGGRK